MPCWWFLIRTKQLSMAATARVIWLCACVRYWPYRRVGTCTLVLISEIGIEPDNSQDLLRSCVLVDLLFSFFMESWIIKINRFKQLVINVLCLYLPENKQLSLHLCFPHESEIIWIVTLTKQFLILEHLNHSEKLREEKERRIDAIQWL